MPSPIGTRISANLEALHDPGPELAMRLVHDEERGAVGDLDGFPRAEGPGYINRPPLMESSAPVM